MSVLAVVPARGGSKGIPRKNLCTVGGLSLIAHAARLARALHWLDRAVLSTEDPEMAEEGLRHGLEVPFSRPAELAGDFSTSKDVWRHAWLESERLYGCRFDLSILLQPTTPLRIPADVERTVRALTDGPCRAATTVSPVPGHFAPEKILKLDDSGKVHFYAPHGDRHSIRQSIPTYYYRNGMCYAVTRETLIERGHIIEEDCAGVIIDRYVVNIDDPVELELAEYFYQKEPHLYT
ncbi:MAG: acylneuraminate cytidylyltransferase family protein [Deferrisomatales bacterium]